MDNQTLVRGLRMGNYTAYEELFILYFSKFVSFADSILHDREVAKDLVQEQFLKVWTNRERLDEKKSIQNYLYVLTKRAILNYLRDHRIADTIDNKNAPFYKDKETPLSLVEINELKRRLYGGISRMPEQRKKIFLLSRDEGLSNREIAERLNLSVRTVERHISLALSDIRNSLS